jgi:hypothetical protein
LHKKGKRPKKNCKRTRKNYPAKNILVIKPLFFLFSKMVLFPKKEKKLKNLFALILPTECWRKNFLNKMPLII